MALAPKVLLFSLFCCAATLNPFLSLVLQDNNFTAGETGTLIAAAKVIALVLTPAVCALADAKHCHSLLLIGLSLMGVLLMLSWGMIIPVHRAASASDVRAPLPDTLVGDADAAGLPILAASAAGAGRQQTRPPGARVAAATEAPANVVDASAVLTALVLGLYYCVSGSNTVITDTLVFKQLDASAHAAAGGGDREDDSLEGHERREVAAIEAYPLQRLWGSISYGLVASVTGMLVKLVGDAGGTSRVASRPYLLVPIIHAFTLLVFAAVVLVVVPPTQRFGLRRAPRAVSPCPSDAVLADGCPHRYRSGGARAADAPSRCSLPAAKLAARHALRRLRGLFDPAGPLGATGHAVAYLMQLPHFVLPLFFGVFFLTLADMATWIFLFPYLRRDLHAPPHFFSTVMIIHLASELASFYACSLLLRGRRVFTVFFVCALSYTVKLYLYSTVRSLWWMLAVEVLHGPCSAFKLSATAAHVTICARRAERFFAQQSEKAARAAAPAEDVADIEKMQGGGAAERQKDEPEPKVELLSTAFGIMWLAAMGLPTTLTGLLPIIVTYFTGPDPVLANPHAQPDGVPTVAIPLEITLFRVISVLLCAVVLMFLVYKKLDMFA